MLWVASLTSAQVAVDPSFGNNGIVQTGFGYNGLVTQNTCKQVLLTPNGSFYLLFEYSDQTFLVRRLSNGALDNSYGENGYSAGAWVRDAHGLLMPDGSVVIGGSSFGIDLNWNFKLMRFLPNGKLDKTFADNGIQLTDFYGEHDLMFAMALQQDNKIVTAGLSGYHFGVARYLPNGMLDNSFSQDGKDTVNFAGSRDVPSGIAIKNDGKIVVVGQSYFGAEKRMSIACFLPDGTRDNSFSGDGMNTFNFSGDCGANAVAVQPNGKIVMTGYINMTYNYFAVVQLNADGSPDNSFSGDGIQTVYFTGWDESFAVTIDNNDKIVAGGYGINQWLVTRLNADGSLDLSMNGNGRSNIQIGDNTRLYSLAIQPDGKILAGGEATFGMMRYAAARFNANGSLDYTFGNGAYIAEYKPSSGTSYTASAVQPDGKLLTVGNTLSEGEISNVCIARYNTNGTLDNSFSNDGKLLFRFGTGSSNATTMMVQPDGKILIGGSYYTNREVDTYKDIDFAVARLNADGIFDYSFSGDGIVTTDMGGMDFMGSMYLQPDGKIICGGSAVIGPPQSSTNTDFAIVRYNANGSIDNSFANDGIVLSQLSLTDEYINEILLQPDGKIIAAGILASSSDLMEVDFAVARYNANGTPDLSFNGTGMRTISIGKSDICNAAGLDANGAILLAGQTLVGSGAQLTMVRFLANGQMDNSFSGDGIVTFGTHMNCYALAIQPNGQIIAGGSQFLYPDYDAMVLRLNSDGSIDNTFSPDGMITTDVGEREGLMSLSILNNRLYGVGQSSYDGSTGLVIAYTLNPFLIEICNFKDDDGDGQVDEGCQVFYQDSDGDGYGLWHIQTRAMTQPPGYSTIGGDCDDGNAAIHPGAIESCNFNDDNCNGHVDEGCQVFYRDADGDGYGLWYAQTRAMTRPAGYSTIGGDCDDANANIHPGATEICNGINDDCDGLTDEGCAGSSANMRTGQKEMTNNLELGISVSPNPSNKIFTVQLEGDRNNGKVTLRIMNHLGEVKETRNNLDVRQAIHLGAGYSSGVYFIEVIQGKNKKVIKVVKL